MAAKLYVVPASHPCAAVMRALEMKDVAYERVDLVPALHKVVQKAIFGGGTVPGIVFEDGEKVLGSRAIIRALEQRRPEPPLFPAGRQDRRLVEEAEEWGDQVLQPLVRRIIWQALSRDTAAQQSFLDGARLVPPTPRLVARLSGGGVAWLERRFNGSTDEAVRADLVNLPRHLDRVDRWIEKGVLGGERTNAGDLQVASGLRLLMTVEDVRPQIDARPAGGFARRIFPSDPGSVPSGALPAEWLAAPA